MVKSDSEIELMRVACRAAAAVLDDVCRWIEPGKTTAEIDRYASLRIAHYGGRSAFLGYKGYPCHTCISVNDEVVHGLAGQRTLQFGDLVSVDVGVTVNGFIGDNARTVAVGGCDVIAQRLMDVTEAALREGISAAVVGNRVGDISLAVQRHVESFGFSVVREFVGHGVGRGMHEEPQIPNFYDGRPGPKLKSGMTLAIEPMVNAGKPAVQILKDGWTVVTRDKSLSAHFEHTVLISEGGPEILTCLGKDVLGQLA